MNINPLLEFKVISKHRMISHYLPKLIQCLNSLSSELIWLKESEDSNSIGGTVLHIQEHIHRNTKRMRDPSIRFNKGIENSFPSSYQNKVKLIEELENLFLKLGIEMDNLSEDQVNQYNTYHLVEHTAYHLGQIVDRTQRLTGIRFQFVQNGINESGLKEIIEEELRKKFGE